MEQSYKEKYEKAIEKIKNLIDKDHNDINVDDILNVFPELAENKDERIRKEIIEVIESLSLEKEYEYIAWLEKQGQVKESHVSQHENRTCEENGNSLTYKGEGIRKEIINYFQCQSEEEPTRKEIHNKWIDWLENIPYTIDHEKRDGFHLGYKSCLERQGEQKPTNKVEPKFKVGDWVVQGCNILKIRCVGDEYYCFETVGGYVDDMLVSEIDSLYHLWTIQDAEDGDVLTNGKMVVIFKHFEEPSYRQHIVAYIGLDRGGDIQITDDTWRLGIDKAKPATKEQRDLLFQKMHEAGYEWDFKKKELKKIEDEHQLKEGKFYECIKSYHYLGGGQYWFEKGSVYFCEKDGYLRLDSNNNIYVYDCKNWQSYFRPYAEKLAWSEEDDQYVEDIIALIQRGLSYHSIGQVQEWLQSLKGRVQPQNTWKPSETDIMILEKVFNGKIDPKDFQETLSNVLEQLKKLNEKV